MFVLDGQKIVFHRDKSWLFTGGKSFLLKRTAYQQERFEKIEWEVLCFYIPDNFFKQFFNEYRSQLPLKGLPPSPPDILLEIDVSETTRAFFTALSPILPSSRLCQKTCWSLNSRNCF